MLPFSVAVNAQTPTQTVHLPTSKTLTVPVPGFVARTNSYPGTVVVSPDGRYAALLNQGFGTQESGIRESIGILDLATNRLQDFPDDRVGDHQKQGYFVGLAFSTDGAHLYASMSSVMDGGIGVYKFEAGRVTPERFIQISAQRLASGKTVTYDGKTPPGTAAAYPAGIVVLASPGGDQLLIANNLADNVILLDTASGQILKSFDVSVGRFVPTAYPYTVIANKSGTRAWVSLWNDSAVAELDLKSGKIARRIALWRPSAPTAPGTHPTAMLLNRDEDLLYVALANAGVTAADGVAAVDLKTGALLRRYRTGLPQDNAAGTAALALALSSDEGQLYAASASLNAVAVFQIKNRDRPAGSSVQESERPIGFIPTEWYPSALALAGNDLLIASAKGEGSGPNNMKSKVASPYDTSEHPYIGSLIAGSLQRLSLNDIQTRLPAYTQRVENNNLTLAAQGKIDFASGKNPIRHVIYILKENRTYDQILGDLPVGDGDPSLTMFGAEITPNEHKLALQFGVLDNFYDSGDVSANGHLWSDGSATSDYIEKIWPPLYRFSDRPEDFGNALEQGVPDMDDPGTGFLWDNLAKHKFTYRVYGEMLLAKWCRDEKTGSSKRAGSAKSANCPSSEVKTGEPLPANVGNPRGAASPWPWPIPRLDSIRPTKRAQRGHIDPLFPDFAIDYPDQLRADEFLREFDDYVKARGTKHALPQFILLYLPNDHTGGTRVGKPTPRASVADNDLAVGRVAAAVSHSPYWQDTAIFVVEDDAQNGADHVDAHRSTALVISKYSPRSPKPFVDHNFYTTAGMVHTMEALIDLPPMNLFDAHAPLMKAPFAGAGNQPPYEADDRNLRNGLLYQLNDKAAPGAKESAAMDFSQPDKASAPALNAILWEDSKRNSASDAAQIFH
jgi:DNA-binding beta-propeller fold protein YncE